MLRPKLAALPPEPGRPWLSQAETLHTVEQDPPLGRVHPPYSWPTYRISCGGSGSTLMLSPKNTGSRRGLISRAGGLWKRGVAWVEIGKGNQDLYTTPRTENGGVRQTCPHACLHDPMRVGHDDDGLHTPAPRWNSAWVRWKHLAPLGPQAASGSGDIGTDPLSQSSRVRCLWKEYQSGCWQLAFPPDAQGKFAE